MENKHSVDDLKFQHSKIQDLLNEALVLGVHSEQGRQKVLEAQKLIDEHHKAEHSMIEEASSENHDFRQVADHFADELKSIEEKMNEFFEMVHSEDLDNPNINDSFKDVIYRMQLRIMAEEKHLFPEISSKQNN